MASSSFDIFTRLEKKRTSSQGGFGEPGDGLQVKRRRSQRLKPRQSESPQVRDCGEVILAELREAAEKVAHEEVPSKERYRNERERMKHSAKRYRAKKSSYVKLLEAKVKSQVSIIQSLECMLAKVNIDHSELIGALGTLQQCNKELQASLDTLRAQRVDALSVAIPLPIQE